MESLVIFDNSLEGPFNVAQVDDDEFLVINILVHKGEPTKGSTRCSFDWTVNPCGWPSHMYGDGRGNQNLKVLVRDQDTERHENEYITSEHATDRLYSSRQYSSLHNSTCN